MPRSRRAAIAVDPNVVVLLLTGDDPGRGSRARTRFANETIWLPKTVVLEAEWVLRRLYGFTRGEVAETPTALVALPNLKCEDQPAVVAALEWAAGGLDFADALHIASAGSAAAFATFDADLVKCARSVSPPANVTAL